MRGPGGWGYGGEVRLPSTSLGLAVPQLEKVLQQGDISECCEPYMVMKEVDTAKVSGWRLELAVNAPPPSPTPPPNPYPSPPQSCIQQAWGTELVGLGGSPHRTKRSWRSFA